MRLQSTSFFLKINWLTNIGLLRLFFRRLFLYFTAIEVACWFPSNRLWLLLIFLAIRKIIILLAKFLSSITRKYLWALYVNLIRIAWSQCCFLYSIDLQRFEFDSWTFFLNIPLILRKCITSYDMLIVLRSIIFLVRQAFWQSSLPNFIALLLPDEPSGCLLFVNHDHRLAIWRKYPAKLNLFHLVNTLCYLRSFFHF